MKDGRAPSDRVLSSLSEALGHRGPDDSGRYRAGAVGIVHTRLAIIDPDGGAQPLLHENGPVLVANGEIYNDCDVRLQLAEVSYKTGSDCESALHLYANHGITFAEHLRGMYAIALYDPSCNRLMVSRDPFGIKPLYFYEDETAWYFSSEPQALVAAGVVAPSVNPAARDEFLALQFSCGESTPFTGIKRLRPGMTLAIENGEIVDMHHRPALLRQRSHGIAEKDYVVRFDRIWEETVRVHQRSDVPYGLFLSGGVDSTAVLAMMMRLNDEPVQTFTAGFGDTLIHDEREHALAVATAAGAKHTAIMIGPEDFWSKLPRIAAAMDDPVADYAIIPTYLLAEVARKSVKVVLTGEGGDEMFAGYGRYRAARRLWPFQKRPWRRHALENLGILRQESKSWGEAIINTRSSFEAMGYSGLQKEQAVDTAHWLPNDLLIKLDRCLMANGVEGRVPFLDPKVANFAFNLDDCLKVRGRVGKWLLREWLAKHFPKAGAFSRKKGFSVPVGEWIAQKGDILAPLVSKQVGIAQICNVDKVYDLFARFTKKYAFASWVLLFYALWHQHHIVGRRCDGDVCETLAYDS